MLRCDWDYNCVVYYHGVRQRWGTLWLHQWKGKSFRGTCYLNLLTTHEWCRLPPPEWNHSPRFENVKHFDRQKQWINRKNCWFWLLNSVKARLNIGITLWNLKLHRSRDCVRSTLRWETDWYMGLRRNLLRNGYWRFTLLWCQWYKIIPFNHIRTLLDAWLLIRTMQESNQKNARHQLYNPHLNARIEEPFVHAHHEVSNSFTNAEECKTIKYRLTEDDTSKSLTT